MRSMYTIRYKYRKVSQEHVNNLKIYEGKVDSKGKFFENC